MKKKRNQILSLVMAAVIVAGNINFTGVTVNAATKNWESTSLVTATESVSSTIACPGEELEVTLKLKADKAIEAASRDVVLLLDRSSKMGEENRFDTMIEFAKQFVDSVDMNLHKVGIVDYASTVNSFPLGTDRESIKSYLDTMEYGGEALAEEGLYETIPNLLYSGNGDRRPIIVYLSAGTPDSVEYAKDAAYEVKSCGIAVNTVALLGADEKIDQSDASNVMLEFASTQAHHYALQGSKGLEEACDSIVNGLGTASAFCVSAWQEVSPEFEIVPGTITGFPTALQAGDKLFFNMAELNDETVTYSFKVKVKEDVEVGTYHLNTDFGAYYFDHNTDQQEIPVEDIQITVIDKKLH